ncbi:MAG TPA: ferredoxin reductase [Acidimicrobiia bacterium]|nr:ferredoxin reductase [Acidimicrobiia bacterium]
MTEWLTAKIAAISQETPTAKTFRFALPAPSQHLAGQHYVIRLTAPDGYTASRSYSVASAPDGTNEIDLTVELFPDGEVSTFLHEVAEIGDEIEMRGPIGQWFVWRADTPALLVGGGSGIVPLMAMLRLARAKGQTDLLRMLVSTRTPDDLYYANELGDDATVVYTRADVGDRPRGRMTAGDVEPLLRPDTDVFVCGSASFASAATDLLVDMGVPAPRVKVERFGPSA